MDFKKIKKAVDILEEHSLTEFSYEEKDGFKLTLKREASQIITGTTPTLSNTVSNETSSAPVASSANSIKAPLVGTFYSAPNPDAPIYVEVGDTFKSGDTLCIVEAMKVMNEIKAENSGTITKVLVQSGDSVEYDQPLFEYK